MGHSPHSAHQIHPSLDGARPTVHNSQCEYECVCVCVYFNVSWEGQILRSIPLYSSCMNSMKRQKDRTLKGELPMSVGAQYATGDQWRNNSGG